MNYGVQLGYLLRYFTAVLTISLVGYGLLFVGEAMIDTIRMASVYGDEPKLWFQRSGAVLVCLAVLIEFGFIKIVKMEHESRKIINEHVDDQIYKIIYFVAHVFAFAIAIIGTLVWGYGDILYSRLN